LLLFLLFFSVIVLSAQGSTIANLTIIVWRNTPVTDDDDLEDHMMPTEHFLLEAREREVKSQTSQRL
jgi:hypothetical protein